MRFPLLATVFLAAACTGGDNPDPATLSDTAGMGGAAERFRMQKASIDSLITNAKSTAEFAAQMGPMYNVANDSLAAAVRREMAKTWNCYTDALAQHDAGLAGVAQILVNFGAAGWDIIRVEHFEFTSPAGGAVVSCINARAKAEWKLPTSGIKAGPHLVGITFRPDSGPPRN